MTDILMISIVPLVAALAAFAVLARFWRWETPSDKGYVAAAAVAMFGVVAVGYMISRFGFSGMTVGMAVGLVVCAVAAFFAAKWSVRVTAMINDHAIAKPSNPPTPANRRRERIVLAAVGGAVLVGCVWILLTSLH